jgi:hypothetical protein
MPGAAEKIFVIAKGTRTINIFNIRLNLITLDVNMSNAPKKDISIDVT